MLCSLLAQADHRFRQGEMGELAATDTLKCFACVS